MSSDRIGIDQVLVIREVDEAEFAAVAFLARFNGRTLEGLSARSPLLFVWAQSVGHPLVDLPEHSETPSEGSVERQPSLRARRRGLTNGAFNSL